MTMEFVTAAQQVLPAAATSLTVAPSGSSWANGTYVQFSAGLASAAYLAAIVFEAGAGGSPGIGYEVDISTGGAGSEVVKGTVRFSARNSFGHPTWLTNLPCLLDILAISTRIAVRARVGGAGNGGNCFIALIYIVKPLTIKNVKTTANALKTLPSAASLTITSNASAWANGTYGQIAASTANAIIAAALAICCTSGTSYEVDLATGGAGTEVVIMTLRQLHINTTLDGTIGNIVQNQIVDNIATTTRVAVRVRTSGVGGITFDVGLNYFDQSGF